jgi:hypothetical protein
MNDIKSRKSGSGKTGSGSFGKLTLAELCAKFSDKNTPIVVGRIWAQTIGFNNLVTQPAGKLLVAATVETPDEPLVEARELD